MPFNARALYELKSDILYRVYAGDGALHFVKVDGPGMDNVWTALLGEKTATRFGRKAREKREAHIAELDASDPSTLLVKSAKNFTTRVDAVRESALDPRKRIPWHGTHVALWRIRLEDGRALRLQIESSEDLQTAIAELRAALGERLTVNV